MKKLLYTGLALLLSLSFLTGCSSKEIHYTRNDKLSIAASNDESVEIPYTETITLKVNGDKVTGAVDKIEYQLTAQYFKDNPSEKDLIYANMNAGLTSVYVDETEDALISKVTLKENTVTAEITTDFTKVSDLTLSAQLLGLDVNEDFAKDNTVSLEKVETILTDAAFTKK